MGFQEFEKAAIAFDDNPDELSRHTPKETTREGGFESPRQLGKSALTLAKEKRERDQLIYDVAMEISLDFLDASQGYNIEREHYDALYKAGWIEYNSQEVARIFHDDWTSSKRAVIAL
jgi:hypothetical protein